MSARLAFGSDHESLDEINTALEDPNCSVDSLLKCRGILVHLRCGHAKLLEFLKTEESMKRLFFLIHTTTNRSDQAALLSLFQTSNTSLHRTLAESITLTDYALSIIDEETENSKFSLGVITRILAKAFDLWPEDMLEVFRLSKTMPVKCIEHMNSLSLFHCAQHLISAQMPDVSTFMWRCWEVVAWPRHVSITSQYHPGADIDRSKITPRHIANLMELLCLYFKMKKDDEDKELAEQILLWFREVELTPLRIKLALVLPKDKTVTEKAIELVKTCTNYEDELFWRAVEYLVYDHEDCPMEVVIDLLKICLMCEKVSDFGRMEIRNLFSKKSCEDSIEIQKLIAKAFSEHRDNPTLLPFIMSCASLVNSTVFIAQWMDFRLEVVDKYMNDEVWSTDFSFL